eukprot:TRINITY_DN28090_c0_g2_i1.p2 TRINITY_DN28090_c0_g2~~TRINITY_DN28090_c0_g2_i1.p2  ORF type:complete len:102 (+),score=24.95 TRINITY_DN28090_c0_g2_i1:62-367(+)
MLACDFFFFFKQKTAYEMQRGLVGSEMCIRDSLYIRYYAVPEHIRYQSSFPKAIPNKEANYPFITNPFAALTESFSSEELKNSDPARLACLIHAANPCILR